MRPSPWAARSVPHSAAGDIEGSLGMAVDAAIGCSGTEPDETDQGVGMTAQRSHPAIWVAGCPAGLRFGSW